MSFAAGGENTMPLLRGNSAAWRLYMPNYRLKWLKNKGAILVVFWSYLFNSVFHVFQYMTLGDSNSLSNENETAPTPTGIILVSLALFFPVAGWLADSYLGRHKVIRYSTWIMWISVIMIILWNILSEYVCTEYLSVSHRSIKISILVILYILMGIGLSGFQANVIQLGIDQLLDSTSTEITSFITSYVFTLYTSGVTFHFVNSCYTYPGMTEKGYNLLMMLYVGVCLTLAMCLDFIFGSCLVKECIPVTTNSVTLIAKVVRYVFKNRNRGYSDMTNTFDIAKRHFGGPFENHHVDQVKRFLRMIVVIAIGTIVASQIIVFGYAEAELLLRFRDWNDYNCYVQTCIKQNIYVSGTIVILLYELIIYPLFNKCIPTVSTTNVMMIGIFLSLLRIFAFLGIELGAYLEQSTHNVTIVPYKSCRHDGNAYIQFSSLWIIVIGSLEGLYSLLFILSGYEFMWAQAPSSMKGLIIGTMYAFLGLNAMLQSAISAPFLFANTPWRQIPLSCGIWYFMMQAIIVFVIFVVFSLLIKQYKQSQRTELGLHPVSLGSDAEDEPQ